MRADVRAAAFDALLGARVINEDSPHQLGGDAEKVRAILPVHVLLINERR